jgi:hypothetical protein
VVSASDSPPGQNCSRSIVPFTRSTPFIIASPAFVRYPTLE